MIEQRSRNKVRANVHSRIRRKMEGTAQRPRLNVYRSLNHIYAQLVDDLNGVTLVSASTAEATEAAARDSKQAKAAKATDDKGDKGAASTDAKHKKTAKRTGGNVASAKAIGKAIAQRAQEKGVKKVVFDRGGYLYHGRIKALAEAAREAGLEF
jgi:large subunit ribosomal protein L18